jgi:hypothetical protein
MERWLNEAKREWNWSDGAWNRYYELLNSLFNQGREVAREQRPTNAHEPMSAIDRRPVAAVKFETRVEEDIEDRFARSLRRVEPPAAQASQSPAHPGDHSPRPHPRRPRRDPAHIAALGDWSNQGDRRSGKCPESFNVAD